MGQIASLLFRAVARPDGRWAGGGQHGEREGPLQVVIVKEAWARSSLAAVGPRRLSRALGLLVDVIA